MVDKTVYQITKSRKTVLDIGVKWGEMNCVYNFCKAKPEYISQRQTER